MTLPGVICKCGSEEILATQSNNHVKVICAKCGRYIKFANKQEKNLIEAITQRNPFINNTRRNNNETQSLMSTLSPQ